jgi:hypothetical protein
MDFIKPTICTFSLDDDDQMMTTKLKVQMVGLIKSIDHSDYQNAAFSVTYIPNRFWIE